MCLDCHKKYVQSNSLNIDRETLKEEIRSTSFVKIGEKYNVTDNAIRKVCKKYNLPYRTKDIKQISDDKWKEI